MAETSNTSHIANKIHNDIFKVFHWQVYSQSDANFECVCDHHLGAGDKKKDTHPGDVVFHYFDPYLNKRVYLHTDLKAYAKASVKQGKIRDALKSLAMTVECASITKTWRDKFQAIDGSPNEVRGLLFVANHDNKSPATFRNLLKGISLAHIPVAKSQCLHILGPENISDLYTVSTDIKLAIQDKAISEKYAFFYPDLTMWKRHAATDERVGATIELLLSPYFIVRHGDIHDANGSVIQQRGSVVYYSRAGDSIEEFVYLLDSLSHYQLVNSQESLRIRVFHRDRSTNLKNNFDKAKERYCEMWGFEGGREDEIKSITIDGIQQIAPNYKADELGWREK